MPLGSSKDLALLARRRFIETLLQGSTELVTACVEGSRLLASQSASPDLYTRRRDLCCDLPRFDAAWQQALTGHLTEALAGIHGGTAPVTRSAGLDTDIGQFSLVDDAVIELDMMVSRLAYAIEDRVGSQYNDLRSRLGTLDAHPSELPIGGSGDVLRPAVLARWVIESWMSAPLGVEHWKTLQSLAHDEVGLWAESGYHEANRALLDHGVSPEIDLRPFIRRAKDAGVIRTAQPSTGVGNLLGGPSSQGRDAVSRVGSIAGRRPESSATGAGSGATNRVTGPDRLSSHGAYDETRLLTQAPGLGPRAQDLAMLGRLNHLVARQVPGFDPGATRAGTVSQRGAGVALAPALGRAMDATQRAVQSHVGASGQAPNPAALVRDLQERKRELKQAAGTPGERATIEIVALLFQSILTDERLPAAVRVWFARLQMPVLRVAVTEPDFFATVDHPARALIDRLGACVMGFAGADDATAHEQLHDNLHKEIKRIVQTVEAYPDTGRRVFQTVLTEFERFLIPYFSEGNESSRKGVSLAQQVEQREAYAIQYTIELRKMLEAVPVHEGVRDFLFRAWADVLAHSAVQAGTSGDDTKALMKLAANLIWSASAKTTREERTEVLQRLAPLLKALRAGMTRSGLVGEKQDAYIKELNAALAVAFAAKTSAISPERLREVTQRLEALDEVLPEIGEMDLDTDLLRDLSGYESDDLEVVAEGGTMPTPAMLSWARELKLGAWFQLDYRGRQEPVQMAWRGMNKQLALFVTPQGRGVLFQIHRLAAFLQAGLILPAEEESLTVRATRDALAKLDADPERLLR